MNEESRLHLVQNSSGALVHTAEAMPEFKAGDVPGWQTRWVDANGIRVHMVKGEPGASFPIHNAGIWIAYVVAGPGTLLLKDTKTWAGIDWSKPASIEFTERLPDIVVPGTITHELLKVR